MTTVCRYFDRISSRAYMNVLTVRTQRSPIGISGPCSSSRPSKSPPFTDITRLHGCEYKGLVARIASRGPSGCCPVFLSTTLYGNCSGQAYIQGKECRLSTGGTDVHTFILTDGLQQANGQLPLVLGTLGGIRNRRPLAPVMVTRTLQPL